MTIWTAPFADGWNAEQNAAGDIGCGGGGTRTDPPTVRIVSADRSLVSVAGPGRSVGWLNDQVFVYLDGYDLRARPLEAPPYVLAQDVVGNSLRAADGHWGAVQVFPEAIGEVVYDGQIIYGGEMWDGLAIAGERLLHTKPDTDGWPMVQEYVSGQPSRAHRLPAGGNAFTLHADGWIGAGYFGESWLLHPGSNSFDLVTVTPWRQEGPPTVALAPDGTPWLWTPTGSPSGRTLVLGRPYGSSQCIVLDLAATWLRVRIINGQWSVVAVDDRGQLRVATVPLDTPRQAVPWEPPAPEPVPPPPPPPVPPFPNPPSPPEKPPMSVTAKQLADALNVPFDVYLRGLRVYQSQVWIRDRGDDIPSAGAMAYFDGNFFQAVAQEIVRRDRLPGGSSPEAFAGDWNALADLGVQRAIGAYKHDQQPGPEDPQ